jgi:hypothetical protein
MGLSDAAAAAAAAAARKEQESTRKAAEQQKQQHNDRLENAKKRARQFAEAWFYEKGLNNVEDIKVEDVRIIYREAGNFVAAGSWYADVLLSWHEDGHSFLARFECGTDDKAKYRIDREGLSVWMCVVERDGHTNYYSANTLEEIGTALSGTAKVYNPYPYLLPPDDWSPSLINSVGMASLDAWKRSRGWVLEFEEDRQD